MNKIKNEMKINIVIGASSAISKDCKFDNTYYFGRTNPYNYENYIKIPNLESDKGIDLTLELISKVLNDKEFNEVNLLLFQGVSDYDWKKSVYVNLISVAKISEFVSKIALEKKATGSITMIGSIAQTGGKKLTYASTKSALVGLMNSLNYNYGEYIRTNLIIPSVFESKMIEDWSEEKKDSVAKGFTAKRLVNTKEIVSSIEFCMKNKYLLGSILNLSSGKVLFV